MRSFSGPAIRIPIRVLTPLLLLITAISALGAGLLRHFSHFTKSNITPIVDSTKMDKARSFLYVFKYVSEGSIYSALGHSGENLYRRGFLQGL